MTKREEIIAEARTWLGTPFHSGARCKGAGVDCGQILLAVYEATGIIPHYDPGYYPSDYHLHRGEEWYLKLMEKFAKQIKGPPNPGDIALWRFGRVYSHAGIIVQWPRFIHAYFSSKYVLEYSAELNPFVGRPVLFFDAAGD